MGTLITTALGGTAMKAIGKIIGGTINNAIFGSGKIKHNKKLYKVPNSHAVYDRNIPLVYGNVKVEGNIIWQTEIKEHLKNHKKKTKLFTEISNILEYSYTISLAIGICSGKVSSIGRIWADEILITDRSNIRLYLGHDEQSPDPLIEGFLAEAAPAYKGLTYAVIQEFNISNFDNKIPRFTFEVFNYGLDKDALENTVESLVIIPGCGEFVYDTVVQHVNGKAINQHHTPGIANAIISLDQIGTTLPKVKWLAPVVSWFSNNLDAGKCLIQPGVEHQDDINDQWSVAGMQRKDAHLISTVDNQLNYGGTVSDISIMRYLQEVRCRGYKIMFYPMLFIDIPGKPWRGKISGNADDVRIFFQHYNKFILHYAHLVKGHVDAFLIGSEMQNLTKTQDDSGNFVAVEELVHLASQVKAILGSQVKISYAANWGEYHSTNGIYFLDKLWASEFIDFVGIDAYFPLSDNLESQYDVDEIVKNWDQGEGYDFYHDANNTKILLDKNAAWKNLEFWWNNFHKNSDGTTTHWQPKMKKIWFTEYGFPSMSCASNEPNVFFDASSIESNFPKYSDGQVDILAQRVAIQGTEKRWMHSEIVERKFLWTWDARPYPAWPNLTEVWSDADNWQRGHWINGKTGLVELKFIIHELCLKIGLSSADINTDNLFGIVRGLIIDNSQSIKNTIQDLQRIYNFDVFEKNGIINFISRKSAIKIKNITYDEILSTDNKLNDIDYGFNNHPIIVSQDDYDDIPATIAIQYISNDLDIKSCTTHFYEGDNKLDIELQVVLSDDDAHKIANRIFRSEVDTKTNYEFCLLNENSDISPGDVLAIDCNNTVHTILVTSTNVNLNYVTKISGIKYSDYHHHNDIIMLPQKDSIYNGINEIIPLSYIEHFQLPGIKNINFIVSSISKKWFGCKIHYSFKENSIILAQHILCINQNGILGMVYNVNEKPRKEHFVIDRLTQFKIAIHQGQLTTIKESELFIGNTNLAMIGDEIIKFSNAELQSDGTYIISNLLRGLYGTTTTTYHRFILLDENYITQIEPRAIEYTISTFLDEQLVRSSEQSAKHQIIFDYSKLYPSPIRLLLNLNNTILNWIPRIFSNELFSDKINYKFYIKILDKHKNMIYENITDNTFCMMPSNINGMQVMIAVCDDNQMLSPFAILIL